MNIAKILLLIRPGEQWVLRGDTLDDLEWLDSTEKPTQAEMEAGQLQLDSLAYRELRAKAYPPIGDQLDALWKGGQAATDMLAQVNAVKAQFPKPE